MRLRGRSRRAGKSRGALRRKVSSERSGFGSRMAVESGKTGLFMTFLVASVHPCGESEIRITLGQRAGRRSAGASFTAAAPI